MGFQWCLKARDVVPRRGAKVAMATGGGLEMQQAVMQATDLGPQILENMRAPQQGA